MNNEKNNIITYQGNQINLYSDDRADYVSLTDMVNAWKSKGKGQKDIKYWIRNQQTVDFLDVWEKKYNPNYRPAQMSTAVKMIKERNFSIKQWVDLTNAKGIFTRFGDVSGTYAHKDIALKFAGWLSPEFELYLVDEIQRLKELERQKDSFELLSHDQILKLVRLKEVFKYVAHQEIIEDAHKELFAARSGSKNPFAEFNTWRNKILDIEPAVIDERIRQYCIDNKIALSTKILRKSKRDKILLIDTYDAVRNAVWDFLQIQGEINALNLANLVGNMIRIEKGEIMPKNETDLFHQQQDLGEFSDFPTAVGEMKQIKTAREVLALRASLKQKELTNFDKTLKGFLSVPPPTKEDKEKK
jgi:hypothetical protein